MLSNSVCNLTGPQGKSGDRLTPDTIQFLPQAFSMLPKSRPSMHREGPQGCRGEGHPSSRHLDLPWRKPGKLAELGILPLGIQNKAAALFQPQLPGAPPAPKGPWGCHSGGQGKQGLFLLPTLLPSQLRDPATRALAAWSQILPGNTTKRHGEPREGSAWQARARMFEKHVLIMALQSGLDPVWGEISKGQEDREELPLQSG